MTTSHGGVIYLVLICCHARFRPRSAHYQTPSYDNGTKDTVAIIFFTYLLTAWVIGGTTDDFTFFYVFYCPLGLGELQARPFPDVVSPPLFLSTLSSSPFHCALQVGFGQTR